MALHGVRAIPQRWLDELELREIVETLTPDALGEFDQHVPESDGWRSRCPGC